MTKQKLLLLTFFTLLSSIASAFMYAPATNAACGDRLLTMPPWYRGLVDGDCNVGVEHIQTSRSTQQGGKLAVFIQVLALNIVEILMHIVAYVSVAFVIIGGFKYITSAGSPDANAKGRQTIMNALIGLVISIASIGIVNFIVS